MKSINMEFCLKIKFLTNKLKEYNLSFSAGFSLVELLIAIGLFGVMMPVLFAGFIATRDGKPQQQQRTEASVLMQESIEALRVIRERGWEEFAVNGVYHPVIDEINGTWVLNAGPENISWFTRQLIIEDVYRDNNGSIVQSGGFLDPSSKQIRIEISWNQPLVSQISTFSYLTRYLDNLSISFNSAEEFSFPGYELDNVDITEDFAGSIRLSPSGPGKGNWCDPSIVAELDLPRQGAARAVLAIPFEVFTGTGLNASGVSLAYVTVTDTEVPVASLQGTLDGFKTNDIFGESGYAYLGTDTNAKEVVIVDTATMTEVGHYDIPGPGQGSTVFVSGNVGYTSKTNVLYLFDLTSKSDGRPALSNIILAGNITSLYVIGTTVYASINSTANQLQVVDTSNPSSPVLLGSLTVNGLGGKDVFVSPDQNRVYLITDRSNTQPEFFLINSENKAAMNVISTYDTGDMNPEAVSVVLDGGRSIIVGTGGEEYQVVNIVIESSISRCGGLNDDTGIYGISAVLEPDGDAYAYVTTGQSSSELKVIEGGPGGTYALTGVYESPYVDAGIKTAFNRFSVETQEPEGTLIRYQVAVAHDVGGSCNGADYQFVGPDGTSDTFFTEGGAIPFDSDGVGFENPGRCAKLKAYFETINIELTPILESIIFNYSP